MYEIKLEQFSGPLDKLLNLIEEKKMEITALNLADVTGDFLNYLKKTKNEILPALLADFVVVAAKLVLIKSKVLVPNLELTEEEETEIKDLESRLLIYREFAGRSTRAGEKTASQHLQELWNKNSIAYARPLFHALSAGNHFYPGTNLTSAAIVGAVKKLEAVFKELLPETNKIKAVIISLEEKIQELLKRFREKVEQSFSRLIEKRSRAEAIVMFLAILHLFRERVIEVEQKSHFGDIMIKTNKESKKESK